MEYGPVLFGKYEKKKKGKVTYTKVSLCLFTLKSTSSRALVDEISHK